MIFIKKNSCLVSKQYIYIFAFSFFTLTFWSSCQPTMEKKVDAPMEKIKEEKVKNLLEKTFKKTGGLENWSNKKSIKFKKYFALFDSLGNTEMSVNQIHEYNYSKGEEINIRWTAENGTHLLKSKNGKITKSINDKPDPSANPTSSKNTVLSSTFVVNIPFNLLDEGIVLEHEGIDTLDGGEVVEVLRADFNPEAHDNHSTKDTWWYYFDKNEHHLVGYMVQHADHFSYVKNLSFTEVDGFTFPLTRKSWRVNKDRELLYLRAEYEYSNYEIEKKKLTMNTILQTPTNDLDQSLDFYKKLNFKVLSAENPTLVSDGTAIIEINPDRFARAGVKLFKSDWSEIVEQLKKLTNVLTIENGFLLSDQSGVWIYLMESNSTVKFDLNEVENSTLGNFAGLSLETTDIQKSVEVWEILGFTKTMGSVEQGWVAYENQDKMGVSFMQPNSCPHLFFNPSLTYFNGKNNLEVIAKIREVGIPITEEITHFNEEGIVDNVIIRDPGGYGFFIFSD